MYLTGWGFPYAQWPQDLKNEYAYNPTAAKQLLADAGFPTGFKTDIVVDETVDLDLLQIIKSYFNDIGINMEIRPMDAASFASFVQISHKNDALCIRKTGSLGLGFYPLRDLLRFGTGQPANVAMVAGFDHFNNDAVAATSTDAVKKILKDANEDVARQHYVVALLQPTVFNFCQPWLKGYNGQYGATAGTTGTFFLFFYEARFWIDQPLKKSLGH
jgi:peptide/nickel transport system substrate-binding protein